MLNVIKYIN